MEPMSTETHPLAPFLPPNARLLMLGSFPPPKARWCMEFFYPNWNNDMWRIWGYLATGNKDHFVIAGEKRFDKEKIENFCRRYGIALYDTAQEVVRLKENASDQFLQIINPTNIADLLQRMPLCNTIVVTGQKAAETLQAATGCSPLTVGECVTVGYADRTLAVWRMPSSSRAYPRSIEWKAAYYKKIWEILL